jgi:FKBP-type peptidyl-prolyl cis-trans isomerase SlyD
MKVEKGKKIKMDYELAVEGGDVVESSATRGPLEYIHGSGKMLAGLESRIEGLTVGEEKSGVIPPAEAYGTEDTLPTLTIPRTNFPKGEEIAVGKLFEARDPAGNPVSFTVVKAEGDEVTVRFNHPLVGKAIRFKVKILEISEPN